MSRVDSRPGRAARAWLVAVLFGALAMGALATGASAATVTASEGPLLKTPGNYGTAEVKAQPGEANRLSITLEGVPGSYALRARDDGEPIAAGAGCNGGGAVGAVVTCILSVQPGSVTVVLGNGGATLDASTLPGSVFVWAGSGDDSIVTGAGADSFFPTRCGPNTLLFFHCDLELANGSTGNDRISGGTGNDWAELGSGSTEFHGGEGDDWAIAGPSANSPDTIDLEGGVHDVADYRLRRERLLYVADDEANDGAPGEGDAVLNAEFFAAGGGNDLLFGDEDDDYLFGGGGSDTLGGNLGDDWLVGENGKEDNLGFVKGIDVTRFLASYPTPTPLEGRPGADRAMAGDGDDRIYLDGGGDVGYGSAGDDLLRGDSGSDRLFGGSGSDRVFGQAGRNQVDGGDGHRDRCRRGTPVSVLRHCES